MGPAALMATRYSGPSDLSYTPRRQGLRWVVQAPRLRSGPLDYRSEGVLIPHCGTKGRSLASPLEALEDSPGPHFALRSG
jgi:hypothetical protein